MTDKTENTETLNDLLPTTPDIQAERLAELKRLFPDLFDGEGRLKLDDVKQLVGDDPQCRERYDFSWYGKRNAKAKAYTPTTATLSYDERRSVNPDKAAGNIIIEGENLETLKTLLEAYRESIKCIYIDPPYNTGKDFVYSDNYSEDKKAYWEDTGSLEDGVKVDTNPETAGRYHSNWLSMMYSRLLLARNLLKDDGVIFVSINDNEVHNLRRIMDEVFGEENFVECISWNKRIPKNDKGIGNIHEYVIIFVKNYFLKHEFTMKKEGLKDIDNLLIKLKQKNTPLELAEKSIKQLYKKNQYDRGITLYNSLNEEYRLWGKINMSWPNANTFGPTYEVLHPVTNKVVKIPDRGWRWKYETFCESAQLNNGRYKDVQELHDGSFLCGRIWFASDENTQPSSVTFLDEVGSFLLRSILSLKSDGGVEVESIFEGKSYFSYPKPTKLLVALLGSIKFSDKDIFFDYFSGSGTIAHSIIKLNQEDSGNRKFILVQLPEQTPENSEACKAGYKKISDITIERVKRVIEGYGDNPQPLDTGFKVYQLTKSHFPRTDFKPDPEKSEAENIEALKQYIAEKEKQLIGLFEATEIQDEVLLKNGFKLNYTLSNANEFTANTVKRANDGEKQSLLCLDTKLHPETVKYLLENPKHFICLETALSTSDKWNLRHHLKHHFIAF